MKTKITTTIFIMSAPFLLSSCASTQESSYGDPNQAQIIGDRWNPTDANLTVNKMINQMGSAGWLEVWRHDNKKDQGERPFILVDDMENRTSEIIDTKALFEDLRSQILNSGKLRFVDGALRQKILNEYKYQQSGVVRQKESKSPGNQRGSDFFLSGAISSIISKQDGDGSIQYQVEMKLTDISTGELVWSGIEKIRKNFSRNSVGW